MAAKEYQPLKQDQPIRDNRFSPVPQKKTASWSSVLGPRWFVSCTCCTAGLFCITSCILKLPGCEDCQQKSSARRDQESLRDATKISFKWHRQCNESMKYWWRRMFFCCKILTQQSHFSSTRNKYVPPNFRVCIFPFPQKLDPGMFLFHVWMCSKCYHPRYLRTPLLWQPRDLWDAKVPGDAAKKKDNSLEKVEWLWLELIWIEWYRLIWIHMKWFTWIDRWLLFIWTDVLIHFDWHRLTWISCTQHSTSLCFFKTVVV